jgi:uncharacterized membrane protein YgdD (TMEM256/DUF423 family)
MNLWSRVVLGLAGLMGAAGVGLAAAAAHLAGGATLAIAANFLLFHAAAVAGISARKPRPGARGTALLAGCSLLVLGTALFAGDLAARHFAGAPLLWGTAPAGGSLAILGWLAIGAAALLPEAA